MKTGQYCLVNAYDTIVRDNVRLLMKETDMCQCEKCYLDVCAMVFNRGYTRFVTTPEGSLYSKLPQMEIAYKVDLTVAIMDAITKVKDSPKH